MFLAKISAENRVIKKQAHRSVKTKQLISGRSLSLLCVLLLSFAFADRSLEDDLVSTDTVTISPPDRSVLGYLARYENVQREHALAVSGNISNLAALMPRRGAIFRPRPRASKVVNAVTPITINNGSMVQGSTSVGPAGLASTIMSSVDAEESVTHTTESYVEYTESMGVSTIATTDGACLDIFEHPTDLGLGSSAMSGVLNNQTTTAAELPATQPTDNETPMMPGEDLNLENTNMIVANNFDETNESTDTEDAVDNTVCPIIVEGSSKYGAGRSDTITSRYGGPCKQSLPNSDLAR